MEYQPTLTVPGSGGCLICVVGQPFCVPSGENLAIRESGYTSDEFEVFTVSKSNGSVILRVKLRSSNYSRHEHFVEDASQNILLTFKSTWRTMHSRRRAFRGASTDPKNLLFSAKSRSSTEFEVFLASNKAEKVPDFKVESRSEEYIFYSAPNGSCNAPVARITKDKEPSQHGGSSNKSWRVEVAPHVDYAFVVTLFFMVLRIEIEEKGGEWASSLVDLAGSAFGN